MYNLTDFTLSDMTRCGIDLRKIGVGAESMEDVAGRAVRWMYHQFGGRDGEPACALVRMFVTMPYAELDEEQRAFADAILGGGTPPAHMKCLTLLATAGDLPAWNARRGSRRHLALPLQSDVSVSRSPMIAQLVRQLGLEIGALLSPDPRLLRDMEQHTFNVFHVPHAAGSPFIPAQQEFVIPHKVQSVVGFGGLLPPGELFAAIIFSKVPIPQQSAEMFKTLALNLKVALVPFAGRRMFA